MTSPVVVRLESGLQDLTLNKLLTIILINKLKELKMLNNNFNSINRISGSEHNYQVWYSDGRTINFSNALELCDYLLLTKKKILKNIKVYVYDVESSSAMCGMLDAMNVKYELVTCRSETGEGFDYLLAFDNINKQYYHKWLK